MNIQCKVDIDVKPEPNITYVQQLIAIKWNHNEFVLFKYFLVCFHHSSFIVYCYDWSRGVCFMGLKNKQNVVAEIIEVTDGSIIVWHWLIQKIAEKKLGIFCC